MKRVYVAGPYNADGAVPMFGNMRRGIKAATDVLKRLGHAPFCPWLDFHFSLIEHIPLELYYKYSLTWLSVSDVMWVLSGWETSTGTKGEIKLAGFLNIPVVYSWDELVQWLGLNEEEHSEVVRLNLKLIEMSPCQIQQELVEWKEEGSECQ